MRDRVQPAPRALPVEDVMTHRAFLGPIWLLVLVLSLAACSAGFAGGGKETRQADSGQPARNPPPAAPPAAVPAAAPSAGTAQPGAALGVTDPAAARNIFRQVAARVQPVVVQINVVQVVQRQTPVTPFDFFDPRQQPREDRRPGLGSGVLIRQAGDTVYVLTNNHVVGDAQEISILLHDQRTFKGELVGKDPRMDLALVKFQAQGDMPVAELGDSDAVQVGDWALAVGNPLGLESTVTAGIISAVGRNEGPASVISDFIQTDAAINPGNSGGALVNIDGQVIGINTWIASPTGAFIGFGFAIPINNAKLVIDQLISRGSVEYGWLGVSIQDVLPGMRRDLDLGQRKGGLVVSVYRRGPADRAGVLPGDFITRVGGSDITDANQLVRIVGRLPVGKAVPFELVRFGKPLTVRVTPAARGEEAQIATQVANLWPGMFAVTTEDAAIQVTAGRIVLAQVLEGTAAASAGLKPGDVIRAINGRPVDSLVDYFRTLNEGQGTLRLTVQREGAEITASLRK